ncbi:MAG: ribbon-helix-helix protein, CopG family [Alphaproteobacteria bacterium]|nr:MAG: ribbon-helix-helix protein, CopG family [Alphaproteobacteria bacterium]
MRRAVHNETIAFRTSSLLVEALTRRAAERGMSVSELVRDAVREKVGLH